MSELTLCASLDRNARRGGKIHQKSTTQRTVDFVGGVRPADALRCTESASRGVAPRRGTSAPTGA